MSRKKVLLHDVIFEENLMIILPDLGNVEVIMATATGFLGFRVLNNTESSYFSLIKEGIAKEIDIRRSEVESLTSSGLSIYDIIAFRLLLKLTNILSSLFTKRTNKFIFSIKTNLQTIEPDEGGFLS